MSADPIWAIIAVVGVGLFLMFGLWPRSRKLDGAQKYSQAAKRGEYGDGGPAPLIDFSVLGGGDSSGGDCGSSGDGGARH